MGNDGTQRMQQSATLHLQRLQQSATLHLLYLQRLQHEGTL
jgi:hypothetical protein